MIINPLAIRRKNNFIPNFSKEQREQILSITNGQPTEFYLRKKYNKNSLEMHFYTKSLTTPRVEIGRPYGLVKNTYYVIDERLHVKELVPRGRSGQFTTKLR